MKKQVTIGGLVVALLLGVTVVIVSGGSDDAPQSEQMTAGEITATEKAEDESTEEAIENQEVATEPANVQGASTPQPVQTQNNQPASTDTQPEEQATATDDASSEEEPATQNQPTTRGDSVSNDTIDIEPVEEDTIDISPTPTRGSGSIQ